MRDQIVNFLKLSKPGVLTVQPCMAPFVMVLCRIKANRLMIAARLLALAGIFFWFLTGLAVFALRVT